MLQSRQQIIKALVNDDANRCCPNCAGKNAIMKEMNNEKEVFFCADCKQEWKVQYTIRLCMTKILMEEERTFGEQIVHEGLERDKLEREKK